MNDNTEDSAAKLEAILNVTRERYLTNCKAIEAELQDGEQKTRALAIEDLICRVTIEMERWVFENTFSSNEAMHEQLLTVVMRMLLASLENVTQDPQKRALIFNMFGKKAAEHAISIGILPVPGQPAAKQNSVIKPCRTLLDANGRPIRRH